MFIVAMAVYITFMGYLASATGFTENMGLPALSAWRIPSVETSWWVLDAIANFFTAIMNVLVWFVGAIVSYVAMVGYSVTGNVPIWVGAFFFVPFGFGMGWLVLSMVRGR